MFADRKLKFPHNEILTGAMLREMYEYPRRFVDSIYKNYSDGIICGLDYFLDGENLILSSGVIRFDGEIYFLNENLNISELAEKNNLDTDFRYYIDFSREKFSPEICITENKLNLIFSEEKKSPTLGSFVFIGKNNFNLPTWNDADDFKDIFIPTNLNLAEVQFAAKGTPTFHPLLFRLVKNFLTQKKNKTPFDYAILTQLQNDEIISVETMKSYIAAENKNPEIGERENFFEIFCECLVNSKFEIDYVPNKPKEKPEIQRKPFGPSMLR